MTESRPEQFFREVVAMLEAERPFALATVVHTSGSTPQKAGARAIILPDGRVLGTLGGGCMEAECRRRALEMVQGAGCPGTRAAGGSDPFPPDTRHPTPNTLLLDLHLDDDFGWDDGLICGGSSQIFVQRLGSVSPGAEHPTPHAVYAAAVALKADRRRGVLAMVVAAADPDDVGCTLLVPEDGPIVGDLDDEGLVEEIVTAARGMLEEGGEAPRRLRLSADAATVYLEPVLPRPVLLIVGAGHVGAALCHYAARIGFEVVVADDRPSFANRERLPGAEQVIVENVVDLARRWPKTPETYVVLVTRGHRNDAVVLREVIGSPCAYIGMIGSRRKVLTIYNEFLAEGIATPEQLARIHAPIGLDIGALTVDEIAVSIAAELIAVRRKGSDDRRRGTGAAAPGCPEEGTSLLADEAGRASGACCLPGPEALNAHGDRAGGGGIAADGDAEAALAVRQRERDRTGRPLVERLPRRENPGGGRPPGP